MIILSKMKSKSRQNKEEDNIYILLVEDDKESAQAMETMLTKRKIGVETVESVDQALERFDPDKHDAIVTDIRLGELSGVDLLRRIREDLPDFPVILLTGFDSVDSAIQAIRLGAQDYILKPLNSIDDLVLPVKRSISSHRTLLKNRQLEKEQKQTNELLKAAYEKIRVLNARMNEITENEKLKITHELHDGILQHIVALRLHLESMKHTVQSNKSPEKAIAGANTAIKITTDMIISIRTLMTEILPLDTSDVLQQLSSYYDKFKDHLNGVHLNIHQYSIDQTLAPEVQANLFRIAQEAIANSAKHAQASQIDVRCFADHDSMIMEIADNGTGFNHKRFGNKIDGKHWGLLIMDERSFAAGGRLFIDSKPGKGTKLTVKVSKEKNHQLLCHHAKTPPAS